MSGRSTSTTALTVAGVTLATGVLAYAVYFDYKRRTDTEFRRQLRKEKKKAEKTKAAAASAESLASSASANVSPEELRAALATLRKEALPATPEEKEMYFMTSVGEGEQLATQGPTYRVQAATAFYRALRVYPSPVELIQIYEKTIPPPVFQLVVQLANMDTIERVQGYYDLFPGKAMNVAIKTIDVPESGESGLKKRKVLVVTKDFAAGEVIYKESPVVAVLDPDLEGAGSHCSHCLRVIDSDTAIPAEDHPLSSVYCSVECQKKATAQYHTLLFSSGSPLPTELAALDTPPEIQAGMAAARAEAQAAFVEFLRGEAKERNVPHLLARFIARQVGMETAKMLPGGLSRYTEYGADLPPVDDEVGQEYSLWDHVERLRFLDVKVPDDEQNIMQKLLRTALPGLEGFLNDERHQVLKGKIMYNSMGITLPPRGSSTDDLSVSGLAGRDDKPVSSERPEDQEKSRTPFGTSRQIGSGFFLVSAYLNHSCAPSAIPSFRDGTAQVSLVANKDLKAGDELTIAFVDVTQHLEETAGEARRRRRWELARGWRFACTCDKCMSENIPAAAEGETEEAPVEEADQAEPELKDESKVEEIALKYDA